MAKRNATVDQHIKDVLAKRMVVSPTNGRQTCQITDAEVAAIVSNYLSTEVTRHTVRRVRTETYDTSYFRPDLLKENRSVQAQVAAAVTAAPEPEPLAQSAMAARIDKYQRWLLDNEVAWTLRDQEGKETFTNALLTRRVIMLSNEMERLRREIAELKAPPPAAQITSGDTTAQ